MVYAHNVENSNFDADMYPMNALDKKKGSNKMDNQEVMKDVKAEPTINSMLDELFYLFEALDINSYILESVIHASDPCRTVDDTTEERHQLYLGSPLFAKFEAFNCLLGAVRCRSDRILETIVGANPEDEYSRNDTNTLDDGISDVYDKVVHVYETIYKVRQLFYGDNEEMMILDGERFALGPYITKLPELIRIIGNINCTIRTMILDINPGEEERLYVGKSRSV